MIKASLRTFARTVIGLFVAFVLIVGVEDFSAVVHPLPKDFGGTMGRDMLARGEIPAVGAGRCRSHVGCCGTGQHMDSAEDRKPLCRWDCRTVVAVGTGLQYFQAALSDLVQGREPARDPIRNRRW